MANPGTSTARTVRRILGLVFVVAGAGKLLLPLLIPILKPGAPTFGDVLAGIGLPFPYLTSYLISTLELAGGACLLSGRLVTLTCILLAGDMVGAMATLSIPGTFIKPLHIGEFDLGGEVWRLPLEASLLLALAWLGKPWRIAALWKSGGAQASLRSLLK